MGPRGQDWLLVRMGCLCSNIKASPVPRKQAGDSRLFWSLSLGAFYSLPAQG